MAQEFNTPKDLEESTDLLKKVKEDFNNGKISGPTLKLILRAGKGQVNCHLVNRKRSSQVKKSGGKILSNGEFYDPELQNIFLSYVAIFAQIMKGEIYPRLACQVLKLIDLQLSVYKIKRSI